MSDAVLDRGVFFPSPITDWYRDRPFKVAFAVSVVIHAILIAFIPGFRSIPIETPRVLEVEIVPEAAAPIPRIQEKPVIQQKKTVEPEVGPVTEPVVRAPQPEPVAQKPQPEPKPEPIIRQPKPEPTPEPLLRQLEPEPPPVPRADIIRAPRAEPKPEFVVPRPELRPEPKAEPRVETRPEPKIERRPEPPPVVQPRIEPRSAQRTTPSAEPSPEPQLELRTEIRPEPQPLPRELPPSLQPRVEPSVSASAVARPVPAPVATAPAPPVVVPQPQPSAPKIDGAHENRLLVTYGQSISKEIKRYQKYPPPAQRRGWEGTAEVVLQIAADGKVTSITLGKSSGHAILDEEALEMVRRATPLPQAPPDLRGRALVVSVPIVFRLQNS